MSKITVKFKFEIGDLVYHKASNNWDGQIPGRFLIVERLAQECPGGIQRKYVLECCDGTAKSFLEIGLTKTEPEYRPRPKGYIEDVIKNRIAIGVADGDAMAKWKEGQEKKHEAKRNERIKLISKKIKSTDTK